MTDGPILSQLGNAPELAATARYAGIIGERPSHGARSPSLWNAVFQATGAPVRFHPLDVAASRLAALAVALKQDARFIGGAVAVPYKSAILPLLDRVEPVAGRIGAVNALYRDGSALVGTNTDGAAALAILRAKLGVDRLRDRHVLLLGTGGTGVAVASYIAEDLGATGRLVLANRNRRKADEAAARIGPSARVIAWPPEVGDLEGVDVLINCSSAGFAPGKDCDTNPNRMLTAMSAELSPAANVRDSVAALRRLREGALVFDVVYQPRNTMLLSLADGLGLATLGGAAVNMEQAVIAFTKAVPNVAAETARNVMAKVP